MSRKSNTRKAPGKSKPRGDSPPFRHASGRWAKKVNGAFVYFGAVADDPDGERAGRVWAEQKDRIRDGYRPILDDSDTLEGVTVKRLCDAFLSAKESLVKTGEMAQRSFDDLYGTCLAVADGLGRSTLVADLKPDDFARLRTKFAKGVGLVTLANGIRRTRNLFKWGFESELLETSARMGLAFKPPSVKALRVARAAKGTRCFEQAELRKIVDAAGVPLKAMILLGINCGLGNSDCARLEFRHVDLKKKWLDFPRPKTGEPRRCKLWPETIKALQAAIDDRPTPKLDADKNLVFVTIRGQGWHTKANSAVSHEFRKLVTSLGLWRPGHDFYALRHTLATEGEGARDKAALARILGHVTPSSDISGHYRERIDDARLAAVADHVHAWLFKPKRKAK